MSILRCEPDEALRLKGEDPAIKAGVFEMVVMPWMIPAGAVVLAVGAWMVLCALRPRRKTAVAVNAQGAVWMRPRDVARLASHAAASVPGVEVLRSEATRRKVVLYVGLTGAGSDSGTKAAIAAAVGSATEILSPSPRIAVRIGTSGSS